MTLLDHSVTPEVALRFLNSASNEVAGLIFPLMPERFRVVSTSGGSPGAGKVEYALPTDCHILEEVTFRATTSGNEIHATELDERSWSAVLFNQFYAASAVKGQVFFRRKGSGQIEMRPAATATSWATFYYRRNPTPMKYDVIQGKWTALSKTIDDITQDWAADEWETQTSYFVPTKNKTSSSRAVYSDDPILVESNKVDQVTLGAAIYGVSNGDIIEGEVYTPTNIPEQYHPLIVNFAWKRLESRPEQQQRALAIYQSSLELLAAQIGGKK